VADAVRFLKANFSTIIEAPLQIYPGLIFAPSKSVIRKTFENAIPRWINNLPTVQESWDACLLTLEGHIDKVWSVVFSHDSKKVASVSWDGMIRIWDIETGKCDQVLEEPSERVNWVVFSYNSRKVASVSYDGTVRIWDTETGKCDQVLEGHGSSVNSVVFSHDLKKVASASYDGTVRIWDAETGKCNQVLEGHSSPVNSVVFSHNSKKVASASSGDTIRIWNTETGKCDRVIEGYSGSVHSVVFSHDSKKVASASYDEMVRIWNAETGKCVDVISLDCYAKILSFTSDDCGIVTNRGVFALTGHLRSCSKPSFSLRSAETPMLDCKEGRTWVTTAGRDLLRLPPECRNGEVAISGSTVSIGCRSGRVVLLGFSTADM
jgi:WD40 repeat protein